MFDDRYGLADRRPIRLVEMPAFPNDQLAAERSHGDLVVQICGGTNETCIHALRRLDAGHPGLDGRALDGARLQPAQHPRPRPHLDPQPARVQGRHGQPRPGRRRADGRPRLGPRRRGRAGVGRGRQLPRGAHHPHAGGVLGPDAAAHAGDDHRARTRTPARRSARPPRPTSRTSPPIPTASSSGWTATSAWPTPAPRTRPATGSCAAASPTPSASTPAGHFDQGLLFQCFQRDLDAGFVTVQNRLNGEALEEYITPVGGGFFFALPGVRDAQRLVRPRAAGLSPARLRR